MIPANDQDEAPIAAELDLMAYLDGELDEAKCLEVEKRLSEDAGYRARLRSLAAMGDFLRDDADRIYGAIDVDGIADTVMTKVANDGNRASRVSALPASSQGPMSIPPPASEVARSKRSNVVWVVFGGVAAAAAAFAVYVASNKSAPTDTVAATPPAPASVTSPSSTTAETVAVKTTAAPTSNSTNTPPLQDVEESVEVKDLEVGEGATVIAQPGETKGSSMVVWVNPPKE